MNLEAWQSRLNIFLFTRLEMISARLSVFFYFILFSIEHRRTEKGKSIDRSKYRAATPMSVLTQDHFLIFLSFNSRPCLQLYRCLLLRPMGLCRQVEAISWFQGESEGWIKYKGRRLYEKVIKLLELSYLTTRLVHFCYFSIKQNLFLHLLINFYHLKCL